MTMTPQGYPLWIAAVKDTTSGIATGRVVGWTDRKPVVAWRAVGGTHIAEVSPPSHGETWWLGDTAIDAQAAALTALARFCPDGHGPMVERERGVWSCGRDGCNHQRTEPQD